MLIKKLIATMPNLVHRQFSTKISDIQQTASMAFTSKQIIDRLQAFAPLTLAETWDNVGLLVDPISEKPVSTVLLTNDLTEDVVQEAVSLDAGLIVSYHPNIFQGLKSVSARTWKERIVVECIKNQIAVFSPHTSWDSVEGGVNDWLAGAFSIAGVKHIQAIKQVAENPNVGAGRMVTLKNSLSVQEVVTKVKQHIGIPHLRFALARGKEMNSPVSTVALCAGSGNSVLSGVEADLYLTGEMLHHDILDATQKGIHVILCNHSDSERGFLRVFKETLQTTILEGVVNVVVSKTDRDPLVTV